MKKVKAIKVTKRSAEKCKERFALQSMEIVGLAQAIIKRRLERALICEEELDCLMQTLLHLTEVCKAFLPHILQATMVRVHLSLT